MQEVNGLPQRSLLSPHLFNLYINDVFERLNTVHGLFLKVGFADDLIVATHTKNQLEDTLQVCKKFFIERVLKLNVNKS
jgi:hypothetical protein